MSSSGQRHRGRDAGRLALLAFSGACLVLSVALDLREPLPGGPVLLADEPGWPYTGFGVFFTAMAVLVLRRHPAHGFGWAMAALGAFWAVDGVVQSYVRAGLSAEEAWPGMTWATWFLFRFTSLLPVAALVLVAVFPDGRLMRGRWGIASGASLGLLLVVCAGLVVAPAGSILGAELPAEVDPNPTSVPALAPLLSLLAPYARPVALAAAVVPMATVVVRHHRATGVERDRMRWLLWAVIVAALVLALTTLLPIPQLDLVVTFAVMVLPAGAMTVGILAPQIVAIDVLYSRTLLYASLGAVIVAVDLAVLAATTAVLGDSLDQQQSVLLVLLLTALIYAPLRDRLWSGVRRTVLGDRENPYDAVAGLASTLERSDDTTDQLAAVATAVATAFGVGYVRVEVDRAGGERVIATHGTAPGETRTLPITYRDEEVGRLVLPARGLRSRLSGRDEQLLGDLVRQAATAARTSRLAEELQESRERLVVAREEERRRIRRDLHDGLGPALAGVVFRLESAKLLVEREPAAATGHIDTTTRQLQDVVADVRRLVHDLRPPALDDRGLAGALAQLAEGLSVGGLRVRVEAGGTGGVGTLPAAVEVAAYRIAGEALTNVARHARAREATAVLRRSGRELLVEVTDDGVGMDPATQAGVGLLSLRERASELGGATEITCPDGGGTVVRARLPLGGTP